MTDEQFTPLAERYMDTVFRVAYSYLRCRDDADDVTQDVLIQLYRQDKAFESDAHVKNWLIRVTVNRCKNVLRAPWHKAEDIADYENSLTFEAPECRELFDAVMSLDRRYRLPVLLYYYEGYRQREIAALLGVQPAEIIYTSGASESNNFALKGLARLSRHAGRHIISTPLEHSSVSGTLTALQEQGYEIDLLDIRRDGTVDLDHLNELLRPDTIAVAVTLVDSELGVVQPVEEIAAILKNYPNCHLHVDATQAVGKIPVSFEGVDTMSLTAHKFYGLNGIGLLLKRRNLALEPLIHRSGTPTVALASSLACALELAVENLPERSASVQKRNAELRAALCQHPEVRINSPENAIPHILNLSVRDVKGTVFQRELDAHGVCVSVKSACSSDGLPSRAVFAVSRDRRNALSSWRISLSHLTTEAEIQEFLRVFDVCCQQLTAAHGDR